MWNVLTEEDRGIIQKLCEYFIPKFSEIEPEVVRNRIYDGYCWGEGCLCHIKTIEDWNNVFFGSGIQKDLLTCFDDWEDYLTYDGDFHMKLKIHKKEKV